MGIGKSFIVSHVVILMLIGSIPLLFGGDEIEGSGSPIEGGSMAARSGTDRTVALDGSGEYDSIRDALDESMPGDRILIKEGVYNETIVVEKTITFDRWGSGTPIIECWNMTRYDPLTIRMTDNVTICNLSFRSNGGCLVELNGTDDVTVSNCTFLGTEINLRSSGLGNIELEDCRFWGGLEFADDDLNYGIGGLSITGGIAKNISGDFLKISGGTDYYYVHVVMLALCGCSGSGVRIDRDTVTFSMQYSNISG